MYLGNEGGEGRGSDERRVSGGDGYTCARPHHTRARASASYTCERVRIIHVRARVRIIHVRARVRIIHVRARPHHTLWDMLGYDGI